MGGQTFYGLAAFAVNKKIDDATYMKDYLSYDIMNYIGVETPLTNYAAITVNGEDYGFGVMLERYEKSFLDRAFSTSGGQLYSVKFGIGIRGVFEDMRQDSTALTQNRPQGGMGGSIGFEDRQPGDGRMQGGMNFEGRQLDGGNAGFPDMQSGGERMKGGGMGGFWGRGGGSLVYTDDEISSYSSIFDNAVFGRNSDMDKQRVITAIKNLNAGTDLEKIF